MNSPEGPELVLPLSLQKQAHAVMERRVSSLASGFEAISRGRTAVMPDADAGFRGSRRPSSCEAGPQLIHPIASAVGEGHRRPLRMIGERGAHDPARASLRPASNSSSLGQRGSAPHDRRQTPESPSRMSRRRSAPSASIRSRALRAFRRLGPRAFIGLLVTNIRLLASGRYGEHRYAYDRSFDREYGVDTSGTVPPEEFDVPETLRSGAVRYEPVDPRFFHYVVGRAPIGIPSRYLFIDLGSGKGRGLLLAAQAGFKRVTGVELDPLLDAIARRNAEVFGHRHPDVEFKLVNGNATEFEFPLAPHDPLPQQPL